MCIIFNIQIKNKSTIAQNIVLADGLYRIQSLLDQLASGLESCGILHLMQIFPETFIPLFVTSGNLSNEEVCDALHTEDDSTDAAVQHLYNYVQQLSKDGQYNKIILYLANKVS